MAEERTWRNLSEARGDTLKTIATIIGNLTLTPQEKLTLIDNTLRNAGWKPEDFRIDKKGGTNPRPLFYLFIR
jgi:hypothetical protein